MQELRNNAAHVERRTGFVPAEDCLRLMRAGNAAVQNRIIATVMIAVDRVRDELPQEPSLTHCADCEGRIPEARRYATPGVRLCMPCQGDRDHESMWGTRPGRRS
ncbi:MAG: TraR/DksA C4-type zinc finger protein [Steroidobacterales bacterium]